MPLLSSHRHSSRDLAIWREHEEADMVADLAGKPDYASECIRRFVSIPRLCYAGVSWGKDSVVIAHLLWMHARHVPLIHLRPTNHNPDCDTVRDAYFRDFPGQQYQEITVDYSGIDRIRWSNDQIDKATDQQWYAAIDKCTAVYGRHILGIRSSESPGRRIRMCRWGEATANSLAPIGRWSTMDVFACLAQYRLPVHPAYAMLGGGRWLRCSVRVAEIGDTHGGGRGRREWEQEYYGDILRRLESACR